MKIKYYIYILIIVAGISSCKNFGGNNEGIITYDLEYLDDEKENPIITLLPNEMIFTYKDGNIIQRVDGWLGVFSMIGIMEPETKTKYALLKIMSEKYIYKVNDESSGFGYDIMADKTIEYTDITKEIIGFKCKNAIIKYKDLEFDIFYTEDIIIKNANWNNPFGEINGVLLEYQISMFDINTRIVATKIENTEVDPEIFNIPDGYKYVQKEEMEEVINNLM